MSRKPYRLSKQGKESIDTGGLAGRLVELRIAKGLSQTFMANYLHINRSTYTYYENGHTQPSIDTLVKLADFYGITLDELVRGREEHD